MSEGEARLKRLRWLCRRGMKELDVLFEAFIAREAAALSDGAWPQFEDFLNTEDDVLWDWVLGTAVPAEQTHRQMLDALRQ